MSTSTRITINYRGQYGYGVSIPDWYGGEVVLASDYDKATALISELTDQLNRLRVEHEEAIGILHSVITASELMSCEPYSLQYGGKIQLQGAVARFVKRFGPSQPLETPPAAS